MGIRLARFRADRQVTRAWNGSAPHFARKRLLPAVVMVLLAGVLGVALGGCVYYPTGSGYYAGPAYGHYYHGDDDDD